VPSALRVLRDHQGDAYRPDGHLLCDRLCAHAANKLTRHAAQSTGSLVAHLKTDLHTFWATGTSAPCTGIFKPVWFGSRPLPDIGPTPGGAFDADTLWWHHEGLHRSVLLDYPSRINAYRQERDALEGRFLNEAGKAGPEERSGVSARAFEQARDATDRWSKQVRALRIERPARWHYRRYWRRQNRKAGVEI
jgi:dipeptidase